MSIARAPYTRIQSLYSSGYFMLWTVLESGIAIIVSTMPMLRLFFKSLLMTDETSDRDPAASLAPQLATIGGSAGIGDLARSSGRVSDTFNGYDDDEIHLVRREQSGYRGSSEMAQIPKIYDVRWTKNARMV
jgi:hypothetical protein